MNETTKFYGVKSAQGLWLCHDSDNGGIFWSEYAAHASFWNSRDEADRQIHFWSPGLEPSLDLPLRIISGTFVED